MTPNPEIWESAVSHFRADAFAEACPLFAEWLKKAEAEGFQSQAAAMNLAVCSSRLERWDETVLALEKANRLESLPWNRYLFLSDVEKIQERIGIQDPSFDIANQLRWIFPDSQLQMGMSLGLWGTLIPLTLLMRKRKIPRALLWGSLGFFATLLITCATTYGAGRFAYATSVLTSEDREIPVFAKPEPVESNLLVQLPRGTIVFTQQKMPSGTSGASDPAAPVAIARPIAGYVLGDKLTVLGR